MSSQDILAYAIDKAIAGGYLPNGIEAVTNWKTTVRNGQRWVRWFNDDGTEVIQDVEHVIYSHEFAKALWGTSDDDRMVIVGQTDWHKWPLLWQYHLQQMVIADDPLEYLRKNI